MWCQAFVIIVVVSSLIAAVEVDYSYTSEEKQAYSLWIKTLSTDSLRWTKRGFQGGKMSNTFLYFEKCRKSQSKLSFPPHYLTRKWRSWIFVYGIYEQVKDSAELIYRLMVFYNHSVCVL